MWFGERIEGYSGESLRFSRTTKLDLNVSRITGRASVLTSYYFFDAISHWEKLL